MHFELLSDEQMITRIIDLSCDYDMTLGAPSFLEQRIFFSGLRHNPVLREAARMYLRGDLDKMPCIMGMHVWFATERSEGKAENV